MALINHQESEVPVIRYDYITQSDRPTAVIYVGQTGPRSTLFVDCSPTVWTATGWDAVPWLGSRPWLVRLESGLRERPSRFTFWTTDLDEVLDQLARFGHVIQTISGSEREVHFA